MACKKKKVAQPAMVAALGGSALVATKEFEGQAPQPWLVALLLLWHFFFLQAIA